MVRAVLRRSGERATGSVRQFDPDRSLVEAARRDRRDFDGLYRKYVAQVYAFAFYELRDHHAAEDATEATFLRALVALPRFEERARDGEDASTFRTWLFRIARNVIANERRRVRRHPAVALDPDGDAGLAPAPGTAPDERAIRRDDAGAAWAAVARLPDDRRRAVTLRFVHEMTTREIAAVLGRSEGAVRVLIHRALRSVARDLGAGDPG